MKLYITAKGRYVGTQAEAKADGKGWTPEEVPVDKAGLIDYLNTHRVSQQAPESSPVPDVATPYIERYNRTSQSGGIEAEPFTGLTQAKVDEMFADRNQPKALPRDALLEAVADMTGTDLGFVALEVAARFKALAQELGS